MKVRAELSPGSVVICDRIFFEGDWISDNGKRGRGSVFGFLKKGGVKGISWNFVPSFQYKNAFFLPFVIGSLIAKFYRPFTSQELIFHEGKFPIRSIKKAILQIIVILQLFPLNLSIKKILYPCESYEAFLSLIFPFAKKKLWPVPPSIDRSIDPSTKEFPNSFFHLQNDKPVAGILGRISNFDPLAVGLFNEFVKKGSCKVVYAGPYSDDLIKLGFSFVDLGVVSDGGLRAFIDRIDFLFCPFKDGVSLKNTTATTALFFGKPIFTYCLDWQKYIEKLPFACDPKLVKGLGIKKKLVNREELRAQLERIFESARILP